MSLCLRLAVHDALCLNENRALRVRLYSSYDINGEFKCQMLRKYVVFTVCSWENIQHLETQKVGFWDAWSKRKASKTYPEAGQEEVPPPSDSLIGEACAAWDINP